MNAEFIEALNALEKERGIKKSVLISAFESALIVASEHSQPEQNHPILKNYQNQKMYIQLQEVQRKKIWTISKKK